MAEEVSLYQDPNIHVTNLRAMLRGKTYVMANVTTVSTFTQESTRIPGAIVTAVGGLIFKGSIEGDVNWEGLIAGLFILLLGIVIILKTKDRYWVRIGSASGETNALSATDRDYISTIVNAMKEAIVRRG